MAHDQTKDTTFNQAYAGRSRVRRDLNTLKRDVVAATVGTTSGNTNYYLSERLANTMNVGYVQFGRGYGATVGTGPEKDRLFSTFSTGQSHQVCIWRGPRDNTGASDTTASNGTIFVHKVAYYHSEVFNGTGNTDIVAGPGGYMSSGVDDDGLLDGTNRISSVAYFGPNAAAQVGAIQANNLVCSWTDNDDPGDGSTLAAGFIQGTGTTGGDSGGVATHNHGLWLHTTCASDSPDEWTTGKLELYIFYSLLPD